MDKNQRLQFKDFCEGTSLHGWGFMALGKFKPFQMVFWSLTVLFAFSLCAFFISQSAEEYMNGVEFKTETLTESLDEVYFPAVYVCSNTLVRLSPLLEMVLDDNGDSNETTRINATKKMLRNVLYKRKGTEQIQQQVIKNVFLPDKMKKVFWDFVHENQQKVMGKLHHNHSVQYLSTDKLDVELQKLHPWDPYSYFWNIFGSSQLSNIIAHVKFNGEGILHYGGSYADNGKPRNRFLPYFGTPVDVNYLRSYPKKAKAGKGQALQLWLDAEVFESFGSQVEEQPDKNGFGIGIGHPFDFEAMKFHGSFAKPGMTSTYGMSTSIIHTDRRTFRSRIPISKGNCYFEGEVELAHFPADYFRYSMTNCLNEAVFQKVEAMFNCTPIMAPMAPKGFEKCNTLAKGKNSVGIYDTIISNGIEMTCKANCIDQPFSIYEHYTSNLEVSAINTMCIIQLKIARSCKRYWKRLLLNERYEGICEKVEERKEKKCLKTLWDLQEQDEPAFEVLKDALNTYAKENIALVKVNLVDPYVKKIVRDVKVSFPQFISNIGGNLGLWQGMSIISLVELVYFFIKWLSDKFKDNNSLVLINPST